MQFVDHFQQLLQWRIADHFIAPVHGLRFVVTAGARAGQYLWVGFVQHPRIRVLLTHGAQHAESEMDVILDGPGSKTRVISRSVAKDESSQVFYPRVQGNGPCFGHVSCDSIIMGSARVRSIPEIACNHVDASLMHEAAIGRIAGEQLLKLETLGLTPEEAEEQILEGFLR